MSKTKIMQHMHELGLVPVLRASSAQEAITIADAILAGGVNILEVTMTVPGAIHVIEQLANHHGSKLLLGAGTVLDPETARNSSSSVQHLICAPLSCAAAIASPSCPARSRPRRLSPHGRRGPRS